MRVGLVSGFERSLAGFVLLCFGTLLANRALSIRGHPSPRRRNPDKRNRDLAGSATNFEASKFQRRTYATKRGKERCVGVCVLMLTAATIASAKDGRMVLERLDGESRPTNSIQRA